MSPKIERAKIWITSLPWLITIFLLFSNFPVEDPLKHDLYSLLMDSGHLFLFIPLSIFATYSVREDFRRQLQRAFALAIFAAAVEVIQPYFHRSASVIDFLNGVAGIGFGLFFLRLWEFHCSRFLLWSVAILLFSFYAFLTLLPAYRYTRVIRWQKESFPVLGDFESFEDLFLWRTPSEKPKKAKNAFLISNLSSSGKGALLVKSFDSHPVALEYLAGDLDWSKYSAFTIDIFNPGDKSDLHIRIDDSQDCKDFASRYNSTLILEKGWNHSKILVSDIENGPKDRKLDITHVRRLLFFSTTPDTSRLVFDNARLVVN